MKFNLIQPLLINSIEDLKIFRDDLYPFLGGGNKGRKINSIDKDIRSNGSTAIVTTGGINSNHCRVTAIYAAQNNLNCTLVLHGDKNTFHHQLGNSQLMKDADANLVFVESSSEISNAMDSAMEMYSAEGEVPYYLWGGGHSIIGAKAYIDAIAELSEHRDKTGWYPKYIFLASGTGSTQAGIMAGLDKYNFHDTSVIGISIARSRENAESIIEGFYKKLCSEFDITPQQETIVIDDYLYGGYEKYNLGISKLSKSSLKEFGFVLDTTYTGKAFYGMQNYISNNSCGSPVLFWHTGGLLNYLK